MAAAREAADSLYSDAFYGDEDVFEDEDDE